MKFSEYKYMRPDIEEEQKSFAKMAERFKSADNGEEQLNLYYEINELFKKVATMHTIASVRHSIDTNDSFYDEEYQYMNKIGPLLDEMEVELGKILLDSPFRTELVAELGSLVFKKAENRKKSFSQEIIADLQKENELVSEYQKLLASASIEYRGEELNLSQLIPFMQDPDRQTRKEASELYNGFLSDHSEEFDQLYDKLVKLRTEMAGKLGFDSYLELGYIRMERFDYDKTMVSRFRKQIHEDIVPLTVELWERQRKRLGLETLFNYDEQFSFPSGNPLPQGDASWILEQGKIMYRELSPETDEFFSFMSENELLDLEAKKGKRMGGFCTFLFDYKAPFIFSNFNGTAADIRVLTHEAGHAFMSYCCRDYKITDYMWPTFEACEIHSMSMEFLTWPWMDRFFGEDLEKFKYAHLSKALFFLPYGSAVDEFQHYVYENPDVTPAERRAQWRAIEKKYLPLRNYDNNSYLEEGGFWHKQMHIFARPFYYIDYVLAQICAFQFFKLSLEDRDKAWSSYLALCAKGGSDSFLKLLDYAGLDSPFNEGVIKSISQVMTEILNGIDDSGF